MRSNKFATLLLLTLTAQAFAEYIYKPETAYIVRKSITRQVVKPITGKFDSLANLSIIGQLLDYPEKGVENLDELSVGDKRMKCQVSPQEKLQSNKIEQQFSIENWNYFRKSRKSFVPLIANTNNPVSMKIGMLDKYKGTVSVIDCQYLNPDGKSRLSIDDVSNYLAATAFASSKPFLSKRRYLEHYQMKRWWNDLSLSKVPMDNSMAKDIMTELLGQDDGNTAAADLLDATTGEAYEGQLQRDNGQDGSSGNTR